MPLQRTISIPGLLFTSLSCMVGSGWLFGAYYAAQIAGPASIISWVLGGGMIVFIAFTFSELSTMLPLAGGVARFSLFTHGTTVSFCMSWLAWLSCVAVAPTEIQALLQYSTHYFPWLTHTNGGLPVLTTPGLMTAALLLLITSALNIMGIKALTRYNTLLTLWKFGVPILVMFVLFRVHFNIDNLTHYGGFAPEGWHGILWALPTAGIVFSFLGFREATSLAGEARNPSVAVPVAVIGSVLLCVLLYVGIQLVFLGALSPATLANGWSHLHFVGDAGPFAGIAHTLGLAWLATLIYTDSILSPFGTAFIYTATTARLNYAMSVNRYTPQSMLRLNKKGVPLIAILFNFLIGLLLFLPFPTWQALVGFQSVAIVLAYAMGPISLLALRKQAPDLKRPFRLPFKNTLCVITFYCCNLIAYWTGWATLWRLMISIAAGFALLALYRRFGTKDRYKLELGAALWLLPYFLGLITLSYLGSFGGGQNIMPFGWDFFWVALYTLICLVLAHRSRLPAATTQMLLPMESSYGNVAE